MNSLEIETSNDRKHKQSNKKRVHIFRYIYMNSIVLQRIIRVSIDKNATGFNNRFDESYTRYAYIKMSSLNIMNKVIALKYAI